jgi:hypothetical protein
MAIPRLSRRPHGQLGIGQGNVLDLPILKQSMRCAGAVRRQYGISSCAVLSHGEFGDTGPLRHWPKIPHQ